MRAVAGLTHPRVGVAVALFARLPCGAIDGTRTLLIQRGRQPGLGTWCAPGGRQELGETLAAAAAREAEEEVGVRVVVHPTFPVFTATDVLAYEDGEDGEEGRRLAFHYAIVHVLAYLSVDAPGGVAQLPRLTGRSDAVGAAWVRLGPLAGSGECGVLRGGGPLLDMDALHEGRLLAPQTRDVARLAVAAWRERGYAVAAPEAVVVGHG